MAETFQISFSSQIWNGNTQSINIELVVEPHMCATTVISAVENIDEGIYYMHDMEIILGGGALQWVPTPLISTCPDDPQCCGELIYTIQENYSFLTNTNNTISLESYSIEDIGIYTAHFQIEIEGWPAIAPLVTEI